MPHNWRIVFISLIAVGVTACGMMPPQRHADKNRLTEPASVESLERSDSELTALATTRWWLDYHQSIRLQTPKRIGAEYKSAEAALAADDSLHNRLRMATLLSLSDMSFHDPERALKLLNDIIGEQNHQPKIIRDTATLVRANILSAQREQQDQKKIQTLSNKLKELQDNNTAIQQQLDALKEIERSIYERRKVEVTNKQ